MFYHGPVSPLGVSLLLAHAAPVTLQVSGVESTRALGVWLKGSDTPTLAACGDGVPPDEEPDGLWTCEADVVPGDFEIGLVRDGKLSWVGDQEIAPGASVWIELSSGRSVLHPGPAPPGDAPSAREPWHTVLVRVAGHPGSVPPVVQLQTASGATEMGCHDDGGFPEHAADDGVFGCGGSMPAVELSASVSLKFGSEPVVAGEVSWETAPSVRYIELVAGQPASTAPFSLVPAEKVELPPAGAPAPVPLSGNEPMMRAPEAPGGYRWGALAVAGVLGLGLGLLLGRRGGQPEGIVLLERPLIAPGGPRPGDPAAVVTDTLPGTTAQVLADLARAHRVVLVADPELAVDPVEGHAVYRAEVPDRLVVERAVRDLARLPGAPLVVLVVGRHTVVDPGDLSADPGARLLDAVAPAWVVMLVERGQQAPAACAAWRLEDDGTWARA